MTNDIAIPLSPFLCPKNMRTEVRRASSHVFEKGVQRQFYISGSSKTEKLGGREASRAGAIEDDRDGGRRWFGVHPIRLGSGVSINIKITEH